MRALRLALAATVRVEFDPEREDELDQLLCEILGINPSKKRAPSPNQWTIDGSHNSKALEDLVRGAD